MYPVVYSAFDLLRPVYSGDRIVYNIIDERYFSCISFKKCKVDVLQGG